MPVGRLQIEIEIPGARSLKDRRNVVRSLKQRLRARFNVAVAEMDAAVVWNRASLTVAAVSHDAAYLRGQLERVGESAISALPGENVSLGEIAIWEDAEDGG